jgi:hypothetical protein
VNGRPKKVADIFCVSNPYTLTPSTRNRKGFTQRRQDLINALPLRALRLCGFARKLFINNVDGPLEGQKRCILDSNPPTLKGGDTPRGEGHRKR